MIDNLTLNVDSKYSINYYIVLGPLISILSHVVKLGGMALTGPIIIGSYSLSFV